MLNFKTDLSPFAVGRRVNSEEWNGITRTFEAADDDARLLFGAPAVAGTGEHSCLEATDAGGENFLGVVEAMPNLPRPGDSYARYDNVPICESGVIAVEVTGNTTKGAVARWDTAARKWTAAAQSGTVVSVPGCQFEETATAPGVAPIRVRRPVPAVTVVT